MVNKKTSKASKPNGTLAVQVGTGGKTKWHCSNERYKGEDGP